MRRIPPEFLAYANRFRPDVTVLWGVAILGPQRLSPRGMVFAGYSYFCPGSASDVRNTVG